MSNLIKLLYKEGKAVSKNQWLKVTLVFFVMALIAAQCGAQPAPTVDTAALDSAKAAAVTAEAKVAAAEAAAATAEAQAKAATDAKSAEVTAAQATAQAAQKEAEAAKMEAETAKKEAEAAQQQAEAAAPKEKDVILFYSLVERTEDHPWNQLVNEYNAMQDDVEVQFLQASYTVGWWEWLGTLLAAGNPPDLMHLSISGLYSDKAGELPLVVDAATWMDEEYLQDVSVCRGSMQPYEKMIIWPMVLDLGFPIAINTQKFEEANIDWQKFMKEGWTLDEFRTAAKALTKDTDGDGEIDQWGYGNALEWLRGLIDEASHAAGTPYDGSAGSWNWGNKVDWETEGMVAWVDLLQAMLREDGSIPEAVLGLPAIQSGHELFYGGQVAMTAGHLGMEPEMKDWNAKIEKGEVVGEKIDWQIAYLPNPYMPPYESVNKARCSGIAVFKQEPYKGDEHTAHAMEFARWLSTPENMKPVADFQNWLPARASLRKDSKVMQNPITRNIIEYAQGHATCFFPFGHPMSNKIREDVFNAELLKALRGDISGAEAVSNAAKEGQRLIDEWVVENPDLANYWLESPWEDWPECYYTPGSASTPRTPRQ